MTIDIQYKLRNDKNCLKYLRENSYWYKYLNRNSLNYKLLEEEMKKNYHLNLSDKISNAIDTIDMVQTIFKTLN